MSSFIRVIQGATVVFNLTKLERFNKNGSEVVDLWDNDFYLNDDDDEAPLHLIARLVCTDNRNPWIVAHYGTTQVLVAPLVLAIEAQEGRSLMVKFRDYSNRSNRTAGGLQENNQCIRRLFRLTFSQGFEAAAFKAVHNIYLRATAEPERFDPAAARRRPVTDFRPPALPPHEFESETEEEEESLSIIDESMQSLGINHEARVAAAFENSDAHTFEDDNFENTQGYGNDDSF